VCAREVAAAALPAGSAFQGEPPAILYSNLKKCLRAQVTMLFWFCAEYFALIAAAVPTPLTSFIEKVFLIGKLWRLQPLTRSRTRNIIVYPLG
jgi:hypothetical protein